MEFSRFFDTRNVGIVIIFGGITVAQAAIIYLLYKRYKQSLLKYDNMDLELAGVRESTNQLWKEVEKIKEHFKTFLTQPYNPFGTQNPNRGQLENRIGNNTSNNTAYSSMASISRVNSSTESEYASANEEPFSPLINDFTTSGPFSLGIDEKAYLKKMIINEHMFNKIDEKHEEGNGEQCYNELKQIYESDANQRTNPELLWRFARACHVWSSSLPQKDPRKKDLLIEGQKYAAEAEKLDDTNFDILKWAAVLTGAITDYLGIKEKIEMGNVFKGYLDKALAMNPTEYSLLHMRGRFSYSVANLSWMERKVASSFFATPPEASFEDAIKDFLEVEKIKNGTWVDNLLYLAKSYLANKNKVEAVKYLKQATIVKAQDDADKEALNEINELLKKYAK